MWEDTRHDLLAHPEVIELTVDDVARGRVRVAEGDDGRVLGFAFALAGNGVVELDGLFVEPGAMRHGVGRALVGDAIGDARARGATAMTVVANDNAVGFYARVGFVVVGSAETRFVPATRMRLELGGP